jgi:hypothetical protein
MASPAARFDALEVDADEGERDAGMSSNDRSESPVVL